MKQKIKNKIKKKNYFELKRRNIDKNEIEFII